MWIKHPKLAGTLVRMVVVLTVMGVVTSVDNFIESVVIPAAQSAIVHLQEKQDTYYVKVDVAKIYKEPNSHAVRLTNALYGDLVYKIDDAKMWARVSYQTSEGKTVIGWVAKRNLMSYSDYVHVLVGAHLAGSVVGGERSWVGNGAVVSNNLTVCADCMIGAGAVVVNGIS